MDEWILQIISFLKVIAVAGYAFFYGFGGLEGTNKLWRRCVGSVFITAVLVGFSLWQGNFSWWYLSWFPLLWASTSIGYGAEETWEKVWKRALYALACGTACAAMAVINQMWVLWGFHYAICFLLSIGLGVINPVEAREEETIIGVGIVLLPMFMI